MEKKECINCGVKVSQRLTHCPLCGKFLSERTEETPYDYPNADLREPFKVRAMYIASVILFIGVILSAAVNVFGGGVPWSMIVAASAAALYFIVIYPAGRNMLYFKEVFVGVCAILLYVLFWDYFINITVTWSVTYVIPLTFGLSCLTIFAIVIVRRKTAGEGILALLLLFVFTLVYFILSVFVFAEVIEDFSPVPSFVAMLVCSACVAFITLTRFGDLKEEIVKELRL